MPHSSRPLHDDASRASRVPEPVGWWLFTSHLVTVWGIALSNAFHGASILWAGWSAARAPRGARRALEGSAILIVPLVTFTVLSAVSTLFSVDAAVSLGELAGLISLATLPLAILFVRGETAVRRVLSALTIMATTVAAYGIVQFYATDYGGLDKRIPGPFSHYQTFAGVLMIGDLLVLARLVSRRGRWPLGWGALVIINWALMLTLTRGPWVGVAVTATGYVLVRGRRYLPAYVAAGLLFLWLMPASWAERVDSIRDLRDPSNYDRLCMLEAGLHMITERPLFGLGPGMVRERYPIYRHPTAPRYGVAHLHNTFLQTAAETGLLSLGAYLWLMAAAAFLAYRGYRRQGGPDGPRADLYLAVLTVLVGFNVAGLFEANWRDTEVQRLVLFMLTVPLCLREDRRGRSGSLGEDVASAEEVDSPLP